MKKIYFWGSIVSIIGLILTTSLLININGEGVQVINSSGQNHTNININNKPQIPEFEGEIGHFQESVDFTNFIYDNLGKIVSINAFFIDNSIREKNIIRNGLKVDFFFLWENCFKKLETHEEPSPLKCNGIGFSIDRSNSPKDGDMFWHRGALYIRGYFAIKGCGGPHQGNMGCTLRPLNPEDI